MVKLVNVVVFVMFKKDCINRLCCACLSFSFLCCVFFLVIFVVVVFVLALIPNFRRENTDHFLYALVALKLDISVRGKLGTTFLIHLVKLLQPFCQYARDQQETAYNPSFDSIYQAGIVSRFLLVSCML